MTDEELLLITELRLKGPVDVVRLKHCDCVCVLLGVSEDKSGWLLGPRVTRGVMCSEDHHRFLPIYGDWTVIRGFFS